MNGRTPSRERAQAWLTLSSPSSSSSFSPLTLLMSWYGIRKRFTEGCFLKKGKGTLRKLFFYKFANSVIFFSPVLFQHAWSTVVLKQADFRRRRCLPQTPQLFFARSPFPASHPICRADIKGESRSQAPPMLCLELERVWVWGKGKVSKERRKSERREEMPPKLKKTLKNRLFSELCSIWRRYYCAQIIARDKGEKFDDD